MDKVDILVATPLRLKSLIEKKRCNLSAVRYLVLDEADKLFEMGFVEQVDAAVAACDGPEVTRALFSATLPETVEQLARSVMTQPMRLTVGERNSASGTIAQSLVFCGQERGKLLALRQLIAEGIKPPIIVFVQSKVGRTFFFSFFSRYRCRKYIFPFRRAHHHFTSFHCFLDTYKVHASLYTKRPVTTKLSSSYH